VGTTHAPTYIHEKRRGYFEISYFIFVPILYIYITGAQRRVLYMLLEAKVHQKKHLGFKNSL